jgi:putative salt-induced outer membrane protein YdiY
MARHYIYAIVSILLFLPTLQGDILVLTSGEELKVTILERRESSIEVRHEILGDFVIQSNTITSIESSPEVKEVGEAAEDQHLEDEEESQSWNQEVHLGLGYQKGQKESSDISVSYHAGHTKNNHKVTLDLSYRLAESDDEKTLNRFSTTFGNVWLQPDSKWDIFTNLQFDWAEFQSWDQRLLGDLGVQYEFLKTREGEHEFTLSARFGSGFRQEFNSDDDELIPEGLLGLLLDWSVSKKQTITADSTWYPDYGDSSNYRLVTNTQWNLQLDTQNKLLFSVGLHHEYNSVVDPGVKNSDLQITAGIKYLF